MSAPAALVLVVDDDLGVRAFAQRALERAGFSVRAAATAGEAVAHLADEGVSYALLLADLWLGVMSGPDLVHVARRMRPGLRVLIMSGDPDTLEPADLPAFGVLAKPFSADELVAAVTDAMGGAPLDR